ncbi:unnamed protein product [Caenorhabditis auriculariae]|uniref:Uncharacterized protein n=1 Tax=Caenorhabditis auriculariae TaxID=2777116 RepID=A0A8S1HNU2_9PELO|nr:unnamed protein product [Caenorhabditis auriculariae]
MSFTSPAQSLAIYGGTAFLAYLETSGYDKDHPFLLCLPTAVLCLLTLATTMHPKPRFATAASFFLLSVATYSQSSSRTAVVLSILIFSLANIFYYISFRELVTRWSKALWLLSLVLLTLSLFHLFYDLVVAIPFLIVVLSVLLATHVLIFVGAGSLCQFGYHGDYDSRQASFLRLFGSILSWTSTMLFLLNSFTRHTILLHTWSRILFYIAHGLLFIANERTF